MSDNIVPVVTQPIVEPAESGRDTTEYRIVRVGMILGMFLTFVGLTLDAINQAGLKIPQEVVGVLQMILTIGGMMMTFLTKISYTLSRVWRKNANDRWVAMSAAATAGKAAAILLACSALVLGLTGCPSIHAYDEETVHQIQKTQQEESDVWAIASKQNLPAATMNGLKGRHEATQTRMRLWLGYEQAKSTTATAN